MSANIFNKFRRITSSQLYFPEIDGIRFIAIVLVLLFHTHGYFTGKSTVFTEAQKHAGWLNRILDNGDRGVELFFVLSGFILCLPFAQHYLKNGKKISLKRYYLRRVTRLEPPYFIAMTAIFLLQVASGVGSFSDLLPHWLASLIYSHDLIYHHTPIITVVAWSLEIEIQFYLFAPFLFRLLKLPVLIRRLLLLFTIIALVLYQTLFPPAFLNLSGFAQYFLTGILLADLYVCEELAVFFNQKPVALLAFICLGVICYLPVKDFQLPLYIQFLCKLALALFIGALYYMILSNDILKRMFSYKFIPVIGGMCYTIYLLHYTIISSVGRFTLKMHIGNDYFTNLVLQIILLCIPILLVSSVFYYYIERPFMSKKWMDMLMKKEK